MRILFLFYEEFDKPLSFPVSIGLLSALLKQHGHVVNGIFVHGKLDKDTIISVKQFRPDLLAYSCTSPAFQGIKKIAACLHREIGTPAICGGSHPTLYPEETIAVEGIDFVCIGEGEISLIEFVDALEKGEDCSRIPGILASKNIGLTKNLHPLVQDLDSLPWVDYDVFGKHFIEQLTSDGWLRYITSRGCPYNCSYCFVPMFKKLYSEERYTRFRSVDSLIGELIAIIRKYDIKVVNFMDDLFCLRKDRVLEFCHKFKKQISGYVGYSIQTHLKQLDEEMIAALYESRCLRIVVGVESGSQRILDLFNRRTTPKWMKEKLLLLVNARFPLGTWSLNILGNPTETLEEMLQTIMLSAQALVERVKFNIMAPYPKSDLYNYCVEQNLLKDYDNLKFEDRVVTKLKFPDREQAFLEKFFDIGHWYMNVCAPLNLEEHYQPLINEAEQIGFGEWCMVRENYLKMDAALSNLLWKKRIPHYVFVFKEKASSSVIGLSSPSASISPFVSKEYER